MARTLPKAVVVVIELAIEITHLSRLYKKRGIPQKGTIKLYPKTKLVSTHPESLIMPASSENGSAVEVLTERSMAAPIATYASQYRNPSLESRIYRLLFHITFQITCVGLLPMLDMYGIRSSVSLSGDQAGV